MGKFIPDEPSTGPPPRGKFIPDTPVEPAEQSSPQSSGLLDIAGEMVGNPVEIASKGLDVVRGEAPIAELGKMAGKKMASSAMGFADAATFGLADEIAGGREAIAATLAGAHPELTFSQKYQRGRNSFRELERRAEQEEPGAHMGGAGTALGATMGAGAVRGGAAGLMKMGGTLGALQGFGSSQAETVQGQISDVGVGTAAGLAAGGVFALGSSAPWLKKLAETTGIKAIVGNGHLEVRRRLANKGITSEVVDFAQREGILTPLSTPESRLGAASTLVEKYGQRIEDILAWGDKLAAPLVDGLALAKRVARTVIAPLRRGNAGDQRVAARLLEEATTLAQKGNMSFQAAEEYKRSFDKYLTFGSEQPPVQEGLKQIRKIVKNGVETSLDAVAQAMDPSEVGKFHEAKRAYGMAAEIKDLAQERVLQIGNNKRIGLTDWLSVLYGAGAGGGIGSATGHGLGGMVGGAALGATKHLAEAHGNEIASTAAAGLAKSIPPWASGAATTATRSSADVYRQIMNDAARRGPAAEASAHFVLSNRDPEYRRLHEQEP